VVVVTTRGGSGGGEYALSYVGVKKCNLAAEETVLKGELLPTLAPQTATGSVSRDLEDLWFIRVANGGVYAFTFCEAPADFAGANLQLCLLDAAGDSLQQKQPCAQDTPGPGEIVQPLAAGDYALTIGQPGGGATNAYTLVYYARSISPGTFRPCDFDCSGTITIADSIFTLRFLFLGDDPACCPQVGDCDSSGLVDIGDAVFALHFLFSGGPAPDFFPGCGGSGCPSYPCDG